MECRQKEPETAVHSAQRVGALPDSCSCFQTCRTHLIILPMHMRWLKSAAQKKCTNHPPKSDCLQQDSSGGAQILCFWMLRRHFHFSHGVVHRLRDEFLRRGAPSKSRGQRWALRRQYFRCSRSATERLPTCAPPWKSLKTTATITRRTVASTQAAEGDRPRLALEEARAATADDAVERVALWGDGTCSEGVREGHEGEGEDGKGEKRQGTFR